MSFTKKSEKDFLVTESKPDDYNATLQSSNVRLCSLVDQQVGVNLLLAFSQEIRQC